MTSADYARVEECRSDRVRLAERNGHVFIFCLYVYGRTSAWSFTFDRDLKRRLGLAPRRRLDLASASLRARRDAPSFVEHGFEVARRIGYRAKLDRSRRDLDPYVGTPSRMHRRAARWGRVMG